MKPRLPFLFEMPARRAPGFVGDPLVYSDVLNRAHLRGTSSNHFALTARLNDFDVEQSPSRINEYVQDRERRVRNSDRLPDACNRQAQIRYYANARQ